MIWYFTSYGDNVSSTVGSPLSYAHSVHTGQPARTIVPVRKPNLRFFWRRTGQWEVFPHVNHPGTTAQPYLTSAMIQVAAKYGFRTVVFNN